MLSVCLQRWDYNWVIDIVFIIFTKIGRGSEVVSDKNSILSFGLSFYLSISLSFFISLSLSLSLPYSLCFSFPKLSPFNPTPFRHPSSLNYKKHDRMYNKYEQSNDTISPGCTRPQYSLIVQNRGLKH